jgi:hypothetical protein
MAEKTADMLGKMGTVLRKMGTFGHFDEVPTGDRVGAAIVSNAELRPGTERSGLVCRVAYSSMEVWALAFFADGLDQRICDLAYA